MRYIVSLLITLLLVGCGSRQKSNPAPVSYEPGTRTMRRSVESISSIRTQEEYIAMIDHFWDDFDFAAGEEIVAYDTIDIVNAMSEYVSYIPPRDADSLLRALIHRASQSKPVLEFFGMVAEVVLHDPNSPLRNDEYYIPVLESILLSPLLDEYERIAPEYDLEIARKNRIGTQANDFAYTLADGSNHRMHDIEANYTILMFSNPGCPMCREIMEQITSSPLLNELTERGDLRTLSLYPDEDLEAWREHFEDMPTSWIRAYDKGQKLTHERLYNLSAIPALYLLDRDKRVIVKDGTSVPQIENIIAYLESL